jgi:hypothetical protein
MYKLINGMVILPRRLMFYLNNLVLCLCVVIVRKREISESEL